MLYNRNSMLLLKWDLTGLGLAIARRQGADWQCSEPLTTEQTDLPGALDDLIGRLKAGGVSKLPRRACLISDQVVAATLDLPVDPACPRASSEMAEIVRWELDPLIMRRMAGQRLGGILVQRGQMAETDVQSVMEEQARRRSGGGQAPGRHRFGQLALELGLVGRNQLDESLTLQQRYREFGEECLCGFVGGEALNGLDGPEAGKYRWLACGVDASRAGGWRDALRERGVELDRILPLLDQDEGSDLLALRPRLLGQAGAEAETASIDMRPPAPPRLRRPSFLAAGALILIVTSLSIGEAALATLNGGVGNRLVKARAELSSLKQSLRRFDGIQRRTGRVEETLERQRTELRELDERNGFLSDVIATRQSFVENFLASLAACASEDLVIDRIRETREGLIVVGGLALKDTAVQWFAREILRQNPGTGLSVSDKNVRVDKGRLGLRGYAYELKLAFSHPAPGLEAVR